MNYNRYWKMMAAAVCVAGMVACGGKAAKETYDPSKMVVVNFNDAPPHINDTISTPRGSTVIFPQPMLAFSVDGNTIMTVSQLEKGDYAIITQARYLSVLVRVNPFDRFEVPIQVGDTLDCTFREGLPYFTLPTREVEDMDINYDYHRFRRYGLQGGWMSSFLNMKYYPFTLVLADKRGYKPLEEKKMAYDAFVAEVRDELRWLDSLRGAGLMGDASFDYFTWRAKCRMLEADELNEAVVSARLRKELAEYDQERYAADNYGYFKAYYRKEADMYYLEEMENGYDGLMDYYKALEDMVADGLLKGPLRDDMIMWWFDELVRVSYGGYIPEYYRDFNQKLLPADSLVLRRIGEKYAEALASAESESVAGQ